MERVALNLTLRMLKGQTAISSTIHFYHYHQKGADSSTRISGTSSFSIIEYLIIFFERDLLSIPSANCASLTLTPVASLFDFIYPILYFLLRSPINLLNGLSFSLTPLLDFLQNIF
jgi:hypothetical protein